MDRNHRLAGRLSEWNDDKGFGFVTPNGGGDRAFVHVSAFPRGTRRPVQGDLVSYLPVRDERGRLQARSLKLAGQKVEPPRRASKLPRAAIGAAALAASATVTGLGLVPVAMGLAWLVASALAYLMYWADKTAAGSGRRRIPENTLHLASVLGGWPGALLAQQHFRHKTIKQPFQAIFWLTVIANLLLFSWLVVSGQADGLLQ